MAELQGFIPGVLSIVENYESLYVFPLQEGHTYIDDNQLYQDTAAKLALDTEIL